MKKIFILDDNEELLDIMNRLLGREYVLLLKKDTNQVVNDIFGFNPDLIVLDHMVGETSSSDIIRELKLQQSAFSVPIILFSAHVRLGELATIIGAQGYIEKPAEISYIRNYIKSFLD